MTEEDIKSYMEEFNVDRETAIDEIYDYYDEKDREMQEVYDDIVRSTH